MTRIASLCSGYGGLDLATEAVFDAVTAYHAEYEAAPSKVLAQRWPDVPNLGDLTTIDWSQVAADIMTAGYPCQPFSHAGRRKGTDDDRHLWPHVAEAVRRVRPRLVVLENVAGHRTLGFDTVLGDLAALGYDAQWTSLRAADVGAPHGRERLFILASDTNSAGSQGRESARRRHLSDRRATADPERSGRHGRPHEPFGRSEGRTAAARFGVDPAADTTSDGRNEGWPESERLVGRLDAAERGAVTADADSDGLESIGRIDPIGRDIDRCRSADITWGQYEPAIRRWERTAGRVAPAPTELAPRGGQRLSPRFVEWMMGLPAGWVTDVPGISRNEQLKMLGNGVVPQQAAAALRLLASSLEEVAA